jgi:hypothetical protein
VVLLYLFAGWLYLAKSGWLLLSVPNALVRGVYDALAVPGAELPRAGVLNVPNVDDELLNAHISVMNAAEVASIGANNINERGHMFGYSLGSLKEIPVRNIDGVSRVWAVQVASPALAALRKSYGLAPTPCAKPRTMTPARDNPKPRRLQCPDRDKKTCYRAGRLTIFPTGIFPPPPLPKEPSMSANTPTMIKSPKKLPKIICTKTPPTTKKSKK